MSSDISFFVAFIEEVIEGQIERIQRLGHATNVLTGMLNGSLPGLRRALGLSPRGQQTYKVDPDVWLP